MRSFVAATITLLCSAAAISAQSASPGPSPYQTIEGVMTELYASVTRLPGRPFEWDRLRAIMLPGAIMLPQQQQQQGQSRIMNIDEFIAWIDAGWRDVIGTDRDQGFFERQTNLVVD